MFSQRKGLKPLRKVIQRESADEELRSRLWSALKIVLWDRWTYPDMYGGVDHSSQTVNMLLDLYWLNFFKRPLDTRPSFMERNGGGAYGTIRQYFFSCQWFELYDFLEFTLKNCDNGLANTLRELLNRLLEDENAAYRVVGYEVAEITAEEEISAIEEAVKHTHDPASQHLEAALRLLCDRKAPDYRNSIKESISAVEAVCQRMCGNPKATLGDAIKKIQSRCELHPAFEKGISAFYGYASDAGGIRHALTEGGQVPSYADAKFMLVACSSFVNYLLTKAAELDLRT